MLDITVPAPEDSGIAAVSSIKADLMAAMDKASDGSTIILDIGKVIRADSSLAQLIVAFRNEAAARGYTASVKSDDERHAMLTMLCCDSYDGVGIDVRPGKAGKTGARRER